MSAFDDWLGSRTNHETIKCSLKEAFNSGMERAAEMLDSRRCVNDSVNFPKSRDFACTQIEQAAEAIRREINTTDK